MTEDKKKKSGLHKNISSIFEGVPLPQPGAPLGSGGQPPPAPSGAPQPAPGVPPRPLPPPFQALHIPQTAQGYEAARRPQEAVSGGAVKAGGPGLLAGIKDKLLAPKPGISSSRQKTMLVLVPVLFIVLIFVFFKWLNPAITPSQPVRKPQPAKAPKPVVSGDTKIEWEIPAVYPKNLRDPGRSASTEPIVTKQEPVPEPKFEPKPEPVKVEKLVVKGILYGRNNPSAIIGTQIVHEGDKVSGMTIVKIDRSSVEFEKSGEKWKQGVEP